jgi:hypothetical protein
VNGVGSLGLNFVEIKVVNNSYQDSVGPNWPVPRQEFIDYLGAHDAKRGDVQWKDLYRSLTRLPVILQNHRVIFVGAERVRPFARHLGVTDADFVCIPDSDSYVFVPQLAERIGSLLYSSTQPVVVMHAAALAGNCLLLELSHRGHSFFGNDYNNPQMAHHEPIRHPNRTFTVKSETHETRRKHPIPPRRTNSTHTNSSTRI